MKGIEARCIAVLLMASIASCGTVPEQPEETYRIPPGSKVALAMGRFHPTITSSDPESHSQGKSYTQGSVEAIPKGIFECTIRGLFVLFPFCVVAMPILLPLVGVTLDGGAAVIEAVRKGSEQETEKAKTAEQLAAEKAKTAKESAAGRTAEEEEMLAAKQNANWQALAAQGIVDLRESFASLLPFLERVQRYTRKDGSSELVKVIDDEAPKSASEQAQSRSKLDYVFEFAPLEVDRTIIQNEHWFHITARGRLVRLNDKSVVDDFIIISVTDDRDIHPWTPEKTKLFFKDFDSALDKLAQQVVNEWIKPALPENAELHFLKDIEITPEPTTGVVERTDEPPAGVDSGAASKVPIPEFRKPSKPPVQIALAAPGSARQKPVVTVGGRVERPDVRSGDQWKYQITDRYTNLKSAVVMEVETVTGNRIYTRSAQASDATADLTAAAGVVHVWDRDWNLLRQGEVEYAPLYPFTKFPLVSGNTWSGTVKFDTMGGTTLVHDVTAEVAGWERITVPAGTFDAVRINLRGSFRSVSLASGDGDISDTYWYAPAVRQFVKREFDQRSVTRLCGACMDPSSVRYERWELVEYKTD